MHCNCNANETNERERERKKEREKKTSTNITSTSNVTINKYKIISNAYKHMCTPNKIPLNSNTLYIRLWAVAIGLDGIFNVKHIRIDLDEKCVVVRYVDENGWKNCK